MRSGERAEETAQTAPAGPAPTDLEAVARVREITRRSGSSFYYSFLLLPRPKREAIYAIYALSRAVDDAVDEAPGPEEARARLDEWRREIGCLAAGRARHPVALAVALAMRRYPIPMDAIEALLEGARMDIDRSRYATFDELRGYCERVASAIGRMCIEIFGYTSPSTRDYARDLGIALQLTNILRDLGSDARRGRLYLPEEDLGRFSVPESEILEGRRTDRVLALLRFEADRARSYYGSASAALVPADRRSLLAAEVMHRIYRRLLETIERSSFDVFSHRISLSRTRRASLALGVVARTALGW